jgi:endonuclease/exonuclease/phosphatase family metal-dependent hydrolase
VAQTATYPLKPGFLFPFNIFIAIITVLLYYTPHIPPSGLWIAAFLPFLIPVFMVLNLSLIIYWIFKSWRKSLLSFMVIVAGYSYINRTIACNFNKEKSAEGLKIINYNVRVFNTYAHLQDENMNSSKKMIQWLASSDADILCLEEFYDERKSNVYNTVKTLGRAYSFCHYIPFFAYPDSNSSFGMAIFSRLPIIKKGNIKLSARSNNQIIFADIIFQKDTVRIYNIHLQSMSIKDKELSLSGSTWKDVLKKLKKGAIQRTSQIRALTENIKSCPYPVIVTGDLNDTPYSYSYQTLREKLNNSFEKAGNGLGFSYNGKLYLRIDQQFASPELNIKRFTTHNEIKYSDHFPLEGVYSFDK